MTTKPIKTAYTENSAFQYDEIRFSTPQGNHFDKLENYELERCLLPIDKESRVVEIGCGTGRFLIKVAKYSNYITGIDPSGDMLAEAEKKQPEKITFELKQGEGAKIPLNDAYADFAYSIRTLNQVESKNYAYQMIQEIFRICKPEGRYLLEIINPKSLNRQKEAVRLTVNEVTSFIKKNKMGSVLRVSGILFFTQTVLEKTPPALIPLYNFFDRIFSALLPKYCSRCYILIKKTRKN